MTVRKVQSFKVPIDKEFVSIAGAIVPTLEGGVDYEVAFFPIEAKPRETYDISMSIASSLKGKVVITQSGNPEVLTLPFASSVRKGIGVAGTLLSNGTNPLVARIYLTVDTPQDPTTFFVMKMRDIIAKSTKQLNPSDVLAEGVITTWGQQYRSNFTLVLRGKDTSIYQDFDAPDSLVFTLAGKVNKQVIDSTFTVTAYAIDVNGGLLELARYHIPEGEVRDTAFSEVVTAQAPVKRVRVKYEFTSNLDTSEVWLADNVFRVGNNPEWDPASGEVYNNSFIMDDSGFSVLQRDAITGQELGRTVMSPFEFAGYFEGEKVFTLNRDMTEIQGLIVKGKGIEIAPVKFVQNTLDTNPSLDIVWTGVK